MLVDGHVGFRISVPPVFAGPGDVVLAFNQADGRLLGQGIITGSNAEFVIEMLYDSRLNGSTVILELQRGRARHQLLDAGQPAAFTYAGGLLPKRLTLRLRIGEVTAILPDTPATEGNASRLHRDAKAACDLATMDVNHDGLCDELDLAVLSLFAGGITRTVGTAAPAPATSDSTEPHVTPAR